MGYSPFMSISIIQDYHCNVHTYSNDFSYSFFVWIGINGTFMFYNFIFIIWLNFIWFICIIHFFSLCDILCEWCMSMNNYRWPWCPLLPSRVEKLFWTKHWRYNVDQNFIDLAFYKIPWIGWPIWQKDLTYMENDLRN